MYAYGLTEVHLNNPATDAGHVITGTGVIATWGPGFLKAIVRAAGVIVHTVPGDAATVVVEYGTAAFTPDSGGTDIDTLSLTTSHTAGKSVYVDGLSTVISPGQVVCFTVTEAAASGSVIPWLLVEYVPEIPANHTNMVESA
jgi:hypothetical protein